MANDVASLALVDRIERLANLTGPSGHEAPVRREIRAQVEPLADEVWEDALGNLYAVKRPRDGGCSGRPRKVMLAAHMDEIGVVVTHIDEQGFLRFAAVGSVSPAVLLGQRVVFQDGTVGVVDAEHLEEIKDLKLERMFIDIGAPNAQRAREKVSVGAMATYHRTAERLDGGRRLAGKAMDDRAGCGAVIEALARLERPCHEVTAVFTVQEEVGSRGARPAAFRVAPDVALAVDVTATGDTPKARTMAVSLGQGVAIKVKDRSVITHPGLRQLLVERARQHGIPYQMEVLDFGGTDAGPIHTSRDGVPSAVLSIPTRYVHTPGEVVDLGDAEATVRLLVQLLQDEIPL
ncbi:MAG: M42 family metallopeptidase [Limnochordaceae bacterium]|nr:M42 family metallopeptidase [Limnochordaceae bacterium]